MRYDVKYMAAFIVAIVLLSFPAMAANNDPLCGESGNGWQCLWKGVTEDDTLQPGKWVGGKGLFFVSGTQDSASFTMKYDPFYRSGVVNFQSVDGDAAPDGMTFDATTAIDTGMPLFELPYGFMLPTFTSAGGTAMDMDMYILEVKETD